MSRNFFDELCESRPAGGAPVDRSKLSGYAEHELPELERLYDVRISGELRLFMLAMGRCDGGLIGQDPIVLYRDAWNPRDQMEFQQSFRKRLEQAEMQIYCEEKPFVLSNESEVHFYFLLTASTEPDLVYHYNQTDESAHSTGLPLQEYLRGVLRRYAGYGMREARRGELLPNAGEAGNFAARDSL